MKPRNFLEEIIRLDVADMTFGIDIKKPKDTQRIVKSYIERIKGIDYMNRFELLILDVEIFNNDYLLSHPKVTFKDLDIDLYDEMDIRDFQNEITLSIFRYILNKELNEHIKSKQRNR